MSPKESRVASFCTDFDSDSDPDLIRRIKKDDAIFEKFYYAYFNRIFLIFYGRLRNTHQAEDLVHDLILQIYKQLDSYQDQGKFTHWVLRVAKNKALNALRDQSNREAHHLEVRAGTDILDFLERLPDINSQDFGENEKDKEEMLQKLAQVYSELNSREKEVL